MIDRGRWIVAAAAAAAALVRSASAFAATAAPAATVAPAASGAAVSPEGIHRALLRALLPFDDAAFPRAVDVEHVETRIATFGNPLANPDYRAALAAFDVTEAPRSFAALSLDDARAFVQRRFDSDRIEQRKFIGDAKHLAMAAVYSDPLLWPTLGYDGPFDPKLR